MTRALILCQGNGSRLTHAIDRPKQFLEVNGETIIDRMVRLLRENGVSRISVAAVADVWKSWSSSSGVPLSPLAALERTIARTIWSQRCSWDYDGETVVLLGDVIYSKGCMRKIVEPWKGLSVFSREGRNPYTGKCYGEIYAVRIGPEGRRLMEFYCPEFERLGIGSIGFTCSTLRDLIHDCRRVWIDDWTDDIDTEADLTNLPAFTRFAREDDP